MLTVSQIRASEDLLTLTRQMQELWVFGKLDTLRKTDAKDETTGDVKAVAEMVTKMLKKRDEGQAPS